jgi:hypothetical protein
VPERLYILSKSRVCIEDEGESVVYVLGNPQMQMADVDLHVTKIYRSCDKDLPVDHVPKIYKAAIIRLYSGLIPPLEPPNANGRRRSSCNQDL